MKVSPVVVEVVLGLPQDCEFKKNCYQKMDFVASKRYTLLVGYSCYILKS